MKQQENLHWGPTPKQICCPRLRERGFQHLFSGQFGAAEGKPFSAYLRIEEQRENSPFLSFPLPLAGLNYKKKEEN
jgi:hypothetical protein